MPRKTKPKGNPPTHKAAGDKGRKPHAVGKAGRKLMLTPEVQAEIVQILKEGNYQKTAYELIGISRQTYFNWLGWGEAAHKKLYETDIELDINERKYMEFFESVKNAIQFAKRRSLAYIQKAVEGSNIARIIKHYDKQGKVIKKEEIYEPPSWQAAAWFLERTSSKEFGRVDYVEGNIKSEVEHSGSIDSGLTQDEIQILRAAIRHRLNGSGTVVTVRPETEDTALPPNKPH